jgi:hypothetical protein
MTRMHDYVDTTPLVSPVNWANIAPFKPQYGPRDAWNDRTTFATRDATPIDFFVVETGPLAPTKVSGSPNAPAFESTQPHTVSSTSSATQVDTKNPVTAEIDVLANRRVRLMAAKYAGSAQTNEILARLEILNRRLAERAPRVSRGQVEAIENAQDQLARIRSSREDRAKRLGIFIVP